MRHGGGLDAIDAEIAGLEAGAVHGPVEDEANAAAVGAAGESGAVSTQSLTRGLGRVVGIAGEGVRHRRRPPVYVKDQRARCPRVARVVLGPDLPSNPRHYGVS